MTSLLLVGLIIFHMVYMSLSTSCHIKACRCSCRYTGYDDSNHRDKRHTSYYWDYCDIYHPDKIYINNLCYIKQSESSTYCNNYNGWYYGWWGWWRWRPQQFCCDGYGGQNCDIPKCGWGASSTSCQRNEGIMIHKNGMMVTNSGGRCIAPMVCVDCTYGYYPAHDGFCRACRQIENCNLKSCTDYPNTVCDWCVGELIRERPGYNVYTGLPDNTKCQRACSWQDGFRCFPGVCTENMLFPKDCKCAKGFGGNNCATATPEKLPDILTQILKFEGDGYVKKFIMDIPTAVGKYWTNEPQWATVTINVTASYKPDIDPSGKPSYIEGYKIGIEKMEVQAVLKRATDSVIWKIDKNCSFEERCSENVWRNLQSTPWNNILQGGFPKPFSHQDTVIFTLNAQNGGNILYNEREINRSLSYPLKGISQIKTFELGFDMYPPEHCYEVMNISTCKTAPLLAKDFNAVGNITVSWGDWADLDSGIHKMDFNMYLLGVKDRNNPMLEHQKLMLEKLVNFTETVNSVTLSFNATGPYSIEMIVYDLAGNHKTTRRIVMFDDISSVELQGTPIYVREANDNFWINTFSESLELIWKGRYINKRHHSLGWLAEVKDVESVFQELDDNDRDSSRSIEAIHNINGTVRVDIGYLVEMNNLSSFVDYQTVGTEEFDFQRKIFPEEHLDGKRITYFVRGVDCMEEFAEDNITVMIDLSPPVINNLWLTKGAVLNISVHSVLELQNLTIEWEVHDVHSGVDEISWKIFDNFTGIDVVHGQSHESPQGETKSIEECEQKYGSYARGHNCYCTPYNGCYHRHYQIKPKLTNTGNDGLHFGKEIGVHDYDYFIEVKVLNNAGLQTIQHHKITIDTSPPHEGVVHDGVPGQPEVDFQQSLNIHAYWNDFFDKESSVWFYMYGFANHCLSHEELDVHSVRNSDVLKTYKSEASFTVPGPGKFYATVMAYNHALDSGKPVCSDGITIDPATAEVTEVVVKGARTAKGLILDNATEELYVLHPNREIERVLQPAADCLNKAVRITPTVIAALPVRRLQNGTQSHINMGHSCADFSTVHSSVPAYITTTAYLDVSWNSSGNVHDYEVGISSQDSDIPDMMNFQSSHHHRHIRLYHPNIFNGDIFYLVIKVVTRSAVQGFRVVGPFAVDAVKPQFTGEIHVHAEHTTKGIFLVASWNVGAFEDHGDPNPLIYEMAIGRSKGGKDVLPFQTITSGGSCTITVPPKCSAVSTDKLPWHLHGENSYYVSIKAKNTVGLVVVAASDEYVHNVEKATVGLVYDIDGDSNVKFVDLDDIDFQIRTDQISMRWSGFNHPHEDVKFHLCLSKTREAPYIMCNDMIPDGSMRYTLRDLSLETYQTYYQIVIAETEAGNVTAVSDGVTVVLDNDEIQGIFVFDGPLCNDYGNADLMVNTSHHSEDKRVTCKNDIDYQLSQNRIQAHWSIPEDKKYYLKTLFWAIEERAPVADIWSLYRPFERINTFVPYLMRSGLHLSPGRKYRTLLKFCAGQYCFKPVHSNGFTCIPNPPNVGRVTSTYNENLPSITVALQPFRDSDMEDAYQASGVIDHYEWSLIDSSKNNGQLTKWQRASTSNSRVSDELLFTVPLSSKITFTKCWKLSVRGYTKAGSSSEVTTELRNCSELQQVKPAIVLDATGGNAQDDNLHAGKPITLDENDVWKQQDIDFTPYNNIISAVWPTLRHKNYAWAVLTVIQEDPTIFYENPTYVNLVDPCSHPDAIKCGTTEHEYVNIEFNPGDLTHGLRYIVCVHANATFIEHEFWKQELAEVNACSDGITVDLTPPVPADVWIGYDKAFLYQTSASEINVNWNSFIDVEEGGSVAHSSGVVGYEIAIGTFSGGSDFLHFTNVGLTNHKTFHRLSLQSGHTYFATVKATDFTGQTSKSTSDGVRIDTSPPVTKDGAITINSRHFTETSFVDACWSGVFADDESGISYYSWAVGSQIGHDDIMSFADTTEECGRTSEDSPLSLKEGHSYFINVKGYNKAGLYSMASSWAFIVDASPPVPGVVCDGPIEPNASCSDVDHIENSSALNVHWTEFYEPHSTIKEYYISVGSSRERDDVLTKQPIGIRYYMELSMLKLAQGEHYYVTITACNTADMCSSSTSDGVVVDSTPPIPGVVIDGTQDADIQYQASTNHIGCKWYGFTDPQSGISHYVWRVGTTKGGDDILTASDVHKEEEAFVFDIVAETGNKLPVKTKLYCAVRAYNNAGKYIESFSNGFIIDDTPPKFLSPLALAPIGSVVQETSVLRSTLKVLWNVQDAESFIEIQYLSITSHIGGDFNLSSTKVEGIVRDYTFTGLDLHDGSYYDITLFSCNGAKLCTSSRLTDILVDSTPPTPGAFAINTDHAANLARQPDDWMTWTSISINLAWLGFEDVHTGIDRYIVNIGSSYMNNDLNEIRYTPMIVNHSTNASYIEDGFVQTETFRTQTLTKYQSVYVSIRAINKVGLSSDIVHSKFNLLFGGMLDLVRRCDSHTCLGHCVCAPHGQLCKDRNICNDTTGINNTNAILEVKDFLDLTFPSNPPALLHTPDNTLLAAQWYITRATGLIPQWFEWSVGESSHDTPTGVFDETSERVWHYSGREKQWIFTLPRGKTHREHGKYSFFVKAWYNENTYAIFKSPGVVVYSTPPVTTSLRGRAVKEVLVGQTKDIDFFQRDTHVNADWTGKFLDTIGSLSRFHVYISTNIGGHDAHIVAKDLAPSLTSVNITGLNYHENTEYFTVVQAYNLAGLHTTESSDGFMLDLQPPNTGIIHHGYGLSEVHATNFLDTIQFRWHGFSDSESGIKSYRYCVFVNIADCETDTMIDAGIATRAEFISPSPFPQGTKVKGGVQALDAAGHISDIVISNGVIIDSTPPVRVKTLQCLNNIISDSSFENAVENGTECYISNSSWTVLDKSCVHIEKSGQAHDGSSLLHLQGSISQTIQVDNAGKHRISFYTSSIPSDNLRLSTAEGYVEVNNERYVFLMYNKQSSKTYAWQKHTFYFDLTTNITTVLLGTVATLGTFALDLVSIEYCFGSITTDLDSGTNHVDVHTVFVHDWASLHAEWVFIDNETEIVDYTLAIGNIRGGTQLQDFTSVGKKTFANFHSLRMEHNTNVFVTVIAENAAGLREISYSDSVMIDLTPPNFLFVNDGPEYGQDLDYQRELQLMSHWKVEDIESGIKECSWAIGTSRGDVSIQEFVRVNIQHTNATKVFSTLPASKLYVTVRCINGAGLTSSGYSDGIRLLKEPPKTDDVIFELMPSSETQYSARGIYHGNRSEIKFRWTGFEHEGGVGSYMIGLEGEKVSVSEIVKGSTFGFTYASFTGLQLKDGVYTASLTGINDVKMFSKRLNADFYLLTEKPRFSGSAILTSYSKDTGRATASWKNVFVSDHPLYYEVTSRLVEGGEGDIVQWQETTNTRIDIDMSNVVLSESGVTVRFSVRAINYAGNFETQYGDLYVIN